MIDEKDLSTAVQEAVELHFDGESFSLPKPLTLDEVKNLTDFDYKGVWMFFEIDTSKISNQTKRINITIPENLLHKVDELAAAEHISRSAKISQLISSI